MKQSWIVISGKAEIVGDGIKYTSEKVINSLGNEELQSSIVKSNIFFDNGEVSFKLTSKDKYGSCQIILNYDEGPMVIVGLNVLGGLYGIAKHNRSSNKFETLSVTGLSETFNTDSEYNCILKVTGSIIQFFVNGVMVAWVNEKVKQTQLAFFFSARDEIYIKDINITTQNPSVFVVMQFTDEYNDLYNEVIKPVTESYGYKCERADEAHTTNPILTDIIQSIKQSSIIIADITPNNPNVFYEVGYAHAINKTTILLCDRKRDKLPFDISGFRTLFYDNTIKGKSAVEKSLNKYLDNLSV